MPEPELGDCDEGFGISEILLIGCEDHYCQRQLPLTKRQGLWERYSESLLASGNRRVQQWGRSDPRQEAER